MSDELECPECDKMLAVKEESQTIGEFLDWLMSGQTELCIAERGSGQDSLVPTSASIEWILALYFGIDLVKIEAEKEALLGVVRMDNHARDLKEQLKKVEASKKLAVVAPRIKRRVTQLFNRSGAGCCLHIVVEDGNLRDDHVDFCIKEATDHRHSECEALARDIRALTEEQRKEVLGF